VGRQAVQGDVGAMLREARERRGLSLRQISNSTKIAMLTLEALERNDIKRLPGGIFSRAFVRAYALEVGLDPEVVIEQFMGQFPHDSVTAGHPTTSQIEDHEAVESERRTASTFLRLIAISLPLAAVVAYFGSASRARRPASEAVRPDAHAVAGGRGDTGSGGQPAVPSPAPPPAVETEPSARSMRSAAPSADTLVVQLSATRTAWVSATVDGRRAAQREFKPGEDATFEVHQDFVLTVGDAGGVAMTFNGMPTKPIGGNGQVVTLRVNLTNFRSYLVTP